MSDYYRFDVVCHYCSLNIGCRRYGFHWVCVDCEEKDTKEKRLPYEERSSDRARYNKQTGGGRYLRELMTSGLRAM